MKVLHIIETPGTGGAEKLLVDIAVNLPSGFSSVGVMMCESWTGRELAKHGIPVTVMPLQRSFDAGWPVRFARFIREQQVDVVHSHEFTANVYATAGARLAGVPIVCTTHGKNYWPHALYRRTAYRWVARNARAFVAVSNDLARFVASTLGIASDRVKVIRNGIDIELFRRDEVARTRVREQIGVAASQPLILTCGEMTEVKGHDVLIRATRHLVAQRPDAIVAIAGEGPLKEQLEALTDELQVRANVRFLGFRRDVPDLLSAADVFVMPSRSEGLPLAILEAMAANLPIVATAVGGVPELIRTGETGWLVPPVQPPEMARAVLDAISDRPARERVSGTAHRLCISQYALPATVKSYVDLYSAGAGN
ncbi:MAG: glycosyltransferase [Steroidobacteraceae bacterium]|nr:glycosyltransferase [Steroidobacteraceae bacterium]